MRGVFFVVALVGVACKQEPKAVPCVVHGDCSVGDACVDEVCTTAQCFTSLDCDRNRYCSVRYECLAGCQTDLDCSAGEECSDGECSPYECRDTQVDCDYGEVCSDGSCTGEGNGACDRCDPGTDDYCFPTYEGSSCSADGSCPTGERCYVADYDRSFTCTTSAECAAGYSCEEIFFSDGSTAGPHCTRESCFAGAVYPPCDPGVDNTCARGFQCLDIGSGLGVCYADCDWLVSSGSL